MRGVNLLKKNTLLKLIYLYIYIIIGVFFIYKRPQYLNTILSQNYTVNLIAYFLMGILFLIIIFRKKIDIFEPIVFVSIIYIPMFTIIPMIDMIIGEILWFGVDLFSYGVKGTIISVIGYIMFCFGYVLSINRASYKRSNNFNIVYNENKIIKLSLFGWIICLILSLIYLTSNGMSVLYALTLGFGGELHIDQSSSTPLGFISMFSYSLIPTWLIYTIYGNSKPLKVLLFIGTIMIQLIRGFRFIVLIMLLSYFFFTYLKKRKQPSIKTIVLMLSLVIILIGVMGFYRGAVRIGETVSWDNFDFTDVIEAVVGNFRIYKTYYAVIKAVPDMTSYMYGKQMFLYTLVMFIPRALWSGKPSPPGMEAIELGISNYAVKAGQAYPNIGEFYYEFGILGVVVFMWLFGVLMKKLKNKYLPSEDKFDLVIYSILVPTTLQIIIRGYTPSNFYLVIFLILPITIIRLLSKGKCQNLRISPVTKHE